MAQAPTGIGKTLGTLFPLLKAMVPQQLDKVLFLTAKTPGRALALEAVQRVMHASPELALRSLELVARDKACEYPGTACHGEACPLARGFYDRLPAARTAAMQVPLLDKALLKDMPTTPENIQNQVAMDVTFWADYGEQLEQRFNAWAAR